ncbi:rho-GTPase-activating protein [Histoplasma ohiense]|nr:rho-GTPase-activating protein [Histoplasma ohiense (nom. inval.)]
MPPPGGRAFPPDLIPGNGPRNNGAQPPANLGDPGMYGESYQTQPPIGNMSSSTGSAGAGVPWDNNNNSPPIGGGAFDTDTYHAPDIRTGRGPHPSNTQQGGAGSGSGQRDRPRLNGGSGSKSPGGRTCRRCGEPLQGQFVRALGGTFHLECFQCSDCGDVVASKFFPVDAEDGSGQYPLCETDYFRRLNLLCYDCGGALRGSYITALDRKYHIEHFTCSACPTVFGAQDSYYEHEDKVYCHYHYSTQFAQRCNGCHTAILKQFVEIFRNGQNQHWHPECYMIHKFWNVRLAPNGQEFVRPELDIEATEEDRNFVKKQEDKMEEKVYRIWSVLSTFEESSAACISDMLLHVSNGAYIDGVVVAKKFIYHVEVLFKALDGLAAAISYRKMKDLQYGREAKLLCKKIVAFFALLSKTQETGVRKLGVTQELLALVTGLAHYLKLLIRIGLQGALKLEREIDNPDELYAFLDKLDSLGELDSISASNLTNSMTQLSDQQSDCCAACNDPIDDECIILGRRRWHLKPPHLVCGACQNDLTLDLLNARWSEEKDRPFCRICAERGGHAPNGQKGFAYVSKLQQYVFLLQVALARLLSVLRSGGTLPHTSDDPNLKSYEANDGHRLNDAGELQTPQRSNTRSRSYGAGGARDENAGSSSLEQTVGEIRRLHSTRTERTLSTIYKKAHASRIIDGPQGRSARPGSPGASGSETNNPGFQIVEERDATGEPIKDLTFGNQDALTLDDIPRIVAAEQAKEQRPNAFRHAGTNLVTSGGRPPKLVNGHQREVSGPADTRGDTGAPRTTKYFSELSALEYFIVRHVAVLSMEPLLEGHFNLEELLGLIESRKPTIWNIFGRAFKNDGRKGGKKKGVFGVGLDALIEKDGTESTHGVGPGTLRIPTFVDDAISAMRQMDMSVEGVFRKNGNIKRLKETSDIVDTKYEQADFNKENPVQIAALLKKFLREMPDPLLTFKLHRLFLVSQKISDPENQRRVLHLTCCLLPKTHRDTMEVLFSFLHWASSFSHVDEESGSKMDIHNIATVMTPNILYSREKTSGMEDSFLAIEAVTALIEYNDTMCEVPEHLQSVLTDSSLFNGSAEITTKEILKRYGGDLSKIATPQRAPPTAEGTPVRTGSGRAVNPPLATRIDKDPSQANARQMQTSVRHVQPAGAGAATGAAQPQGPQQFEQQQQTLGSPPMEYDYGSQQQQPYPRFPDRSASGDSYTSQTQQERQQQQQMAFRQRQAAAAAPI